MGAWIPRSMRATHWVSSAWGQELDGGRGSDEKGKAWDEVSGGEVR
jgi:hypothetical protein